jgi:multidrug efflux pump subunit AcrA (membrane-fusion protein)
VAGGVVGYFVWYEKAYPTKAEQPITEKIDRAKIQDKITASGKVEYKGWLRNVNVEIDGKIVSGAKELKVGTTVKEGDILLKLDDSLQQNQIKQAEAAITAANGKLKSAIAGKTVAESKVNSVNHELELARTQLKSAQEKIDKGVGSQNELNEAKKRFEAKEAEGAGARAYLFQADADIDAANSNIQLAQASLTLAKRALEQTQIKAPATGEIVYIENQLVQDGQLVPKGASLLKIAPNPNQWEVKAQISEQDIGRLRTKLAKGHIPASFSTEAYSMEHGLKRFTGKVVSISQLPTPPQRPNLGGLELLQMSAMGGGGMQSSGPSNYTVTIDVDPIEDAIHKNHPLSPGFTATDIQIVLNEFSNIVTVPSLALSFKPDGLSDVQQNEINRNENQGWSTLWLWENGRYEPRYIKAGASEEGRTHVVEVMNGRPDELLGKVAVVEGPKRPEKGNGLLGNNPIRVPG